MVLFSHVQGDLGGPKMFRFNSNTRPDFKTAPSSTVHSYVVLITRMCCNFHLLQLDHTPLKVSSVCNEMDTIETNDRACCHNSLSGTYDRNFRQSTFQHRPIDIPASISRLLNALLTISVKQMLEEKRSTIRSR